MPSLIDWEYNGNSQLISVTVDDDGDGIIELEPVRHGRWIECCHELRNSEDYDDVEPGYEMFPVIITDYECSECGRVESEREPYCNCGAKMDGGAEE